MGQSTAAVGAARPIARPVARRAGAGRSSVPPPAPRLRVVAPAGRSRAGLALVCSALLVVGLLALLLLNISIGNGAYELTELQRQQLSTSERQQALAERVEDLSAPQRLAAEARRMGMVPAPNTAFVRLSDGTVVGKAARATAPPKPRPTSRAKATAPAKGTTAKSGAKTGAKKPTTPAKGTGTKTTTSKKKPTP